MKPNKRLFFSLFLPVLLSACASTAPPSRPHDMCDILEEKPKWGRALEEARERWGSPPQIVLAIIYQESAFKHDAQPPMDYFLGLIPLGRKSSAYGYPQAKDEVWSDYQRQANSGADRDDFADAADFVGWYMNKSSQINGVSKWDAYHQYLNYHEGWTGFAQRTYEQKQWLKKVALKVKDRAERYGAQYVSCRP